MRPLTRVLRETLYYAGITMFGFILLAPFFWMISGALKPYHEIFVLPIRWIPSEIYLLDNIKAVLEKIDLVRYFGNSAFVAVAVTVGNVLICSMAGYSLAKFDYPGKQAFFYFMLGTLMVPFQVLVIGLFVVMRQLGWIDTYWALIVPVMVSAFGIFLMRQFLLDIPDALIDAARIDGAGELTIFFRIILPLSKSALATLALLSFTGNWDSFLWPLIVINYDEYRTLPLGLRMLQSEYGTRYNELMAASLLTLIPIVLLFVFAQRYFIRAVMSSGVKG